MPTILITANDAPPMSAFIYLASQSPRRSQLLTQIGVDHPLLLPDPHEDAEALEVAHCVQVAAHYHYWLGSPAENAALGIGRASQ